jgi:sulfur-carrier protein adenylyltransferase/sulfurtransferase
MFHMLKKLFSPPESFDADAAKDFLKSHDDGEYTLLDVRQPTEYENSHIPGAKLIPITQLLDRMDELDPEKDLIVYCEIGGRSRVAAQILAGRGFKTIYHLKGGIRGWNGLTADGPVEVNMNTITEAKTPAQIIRPRCNRAEYSLSM